MSSASPAATRADSLWVRFWHAPVRAERLALMRILLATALLADQLVQFLPNFADFYGPNGVAPAGLHDARQLGDWRLSYVFFGTDNLYFLYPVFGLWVAATISFLVGWKTRWMSVLVWFLTRCFIERNPAILSDEDTVLQVGLFLMMLTPCGEALSVDAWLKRKRGLLQGPAWVAPWSLRILQIQLCLIYCTTGLIKLQGDAWGQGPFYEEWGDGLLPQYLKGTWWDGTSMHYFLNDTVMWRRSFAEYPLPFWITRPMTYMAVTWEALFPLLVVNRWTRSFALLLGIMFHIGIFLTVEVGWFGFYTLSFYAVWIPDRFWQRFDADGTALTPG
jgi:hypothetical protein